ncbi:MAG: hypothetical protein IJK19_04650 [Bacteroidales bacterium]|nr:hypothetical protein [Bacteroidales bacterium]
MVDNLKLPKEPAGSIPITRRDIALGILLKPIYSGDGLCARYMENDSVVSFHLVNRRNDFNAEFSINGKTNHKIWLSQLNHIYLDAGNLDYHSGKILYKNGNEQILAGMKVDDFIKATEGRKFVVKLCTEYYAIDFWNPKCNALRNAREVRDYIAAAFAEERYDDVYGMTKIMTLYSLIEC